MKIRSLLFAPDSAGGGAAVAEPPAAPAAAPATAEPAASTDPWADLDKAMEPEPKPAKPDPKGKAPDPKVKDAPKVDPKAPANPEEPKKEEPPVDGDGRKFTTPKALRDAHDRQVAENKKLNESVKSMEAKIKAAEDAGKNTEVLNKRLADLEKERDEAKATVRLLKFEASDEYKAKYEKPFATAATRTQQFIEKLSVTELNEAGEPQTPRKATWEDFKQLYVMGNDKAIPIINAMFGQAAPIVLQKMLALQEMQQDGADALADEKTKWQSREAEDRVKQDKLKKEEGERNEQAQKLWIQMNTDIAEKNPEFFLPDPKDKKAAEILQEAFALVDSNHNNDSLTLQQRVMRDAQVRLRAAGYSVATYKLQQARAEIEELKSQMEELKGSKPGDTQRGGGAPAAAPDKSFDDELKTLDV